VGKVSVSGLKVLATGFNLFRDVGLEMDREFAFV